MMTLLWRRRSVAGTQLLFLIWSLLASAVLGQPTGPHPVCNICGEGKVIGNLFKVHFGKTCEEWQSIGDNGDIEASECQTIQSTNLVTNCECRNTEAPTQSPTALAELQGELVVVLLNVTNTMTPSVIDFYEQDLLVFLDTWFLNVTSTWPGNMLNWKVELNMQRRIYSNATSGGRLLRRHLQGENNANATEPEIGTAAQLTPLETRSTVTVQTTATPSAETSDAAFQTALQQTVDQRPEALLLTLQESVSTVARVYFGPVSTFETFAPNDFVSTVGPDQAFGGGLTSRSGANDNLDEGDEALSTAAIAGIAAGAGFIIVLVAGILCIACRPHEDEKHMRERDSSLSQTDAGKPAPFSQSMRHISSPSSAQRSASSFGVGNGTGGRMGSNFDDSMSRSSVNDSRYRSRQLGAMRSSSTRIVSADGRTLSVLDGTGHSTHDLTKSMRDAKFMKSGGVLGGEDFPEAAPPRGRRIPGGASTASSQQSSSAPGRGGYADHALLEEDEFDEEHEPSDHYNQGGYQDAGEEEDEGYEYDEVGGGYAEEGEPQEDQQLFANNNNNATGSSVLAAAADRYQDAEGDPRAQYEQRAPPRAGSQRSQFSQQQQQQHSQRSQFSQPPPPPPLPDSASSQRSVTPSPAPPVAEVDTAQDMGADGMHTRQVLAPPGKLGIVIETTMDGPIVHKMNPNSPLVGVLFEGDLITEIDNIDCRAMSASAITQLMVRTAEKNRRMTVKSKDPR